MITRWELMHDFMDAAATRRLETFFRSVGDLLDDDRRRQSFAIYAMGLLGASERKSIEPLATQACIDPFKADAAHQRLLHFISNSPWSDRDVRLFSAKYALKEMTRQGPVDAWIVDDTGFLKQGTHSVGVQRQYTGSAGKITNCQNGVSLSVATRDEHLPIDFELYLPKSWANVPAKRREARIPDDVEFKTKPQLALEMIRRAVNDDIPKGVVLGDAGYGTSSEFRRQVRALGLHFVVGVMPQTKVWMLDKKGRPCGEAMSVKKWARLAKKRGAYRRCTWRKGTKEDLSARFATCRVVPFHKDGQSPSEREHLTLLVEWRDGEDAPANYFLSSLSSLSSTLTRKKLVRIAMQRWRTERVYEDLKGELGLDHFEGRRFPGWHHHVTVSLCCYAFIIAERVRHFPPSATGASGHHSLQLAA